MLFFYRFQRNGLQVSRSFGTLYLPGPREHIDIPVTCVHEESLPVERNVNGIVHTYFISFTLLVS